MSNKPAIGKENFGTLDDGSRVDRWTLTNGRGAQVRVLSYGGIIQSLQVPDSAGRSGNVVLGFQSLGDYVEHTGPYFGAIIGRYANRIAGGKFTIDDTTYQVPVNDGSNALHGGNKGFDKRVWEVRPVPQGDSVGLSLSYTSADGEEGYPGRLTVGVEYTLTALGALRIDYRATTDQPTVINLTNHSYFNLAGETSGDVYQHRLSLAAGSYTPVDANLIPTGEVVPVAGTPFDFRRTTLIGERIRDPHEQMIRGHGYDHNYVLDKGLTSDAQEFATVYDPASGRVLTVATTEPAVQFYTANHLDGSMVGSGGHTYRPGDAFCLETQHFPDAPNQPNFPSTVLRPGRAFTSSTVYAFATAER